MGVKKSTVLTIARSGRRRNTPASSEVSVPTIKSGWSNFGRLCNTCDRSAGPSLAAQPAAATCRVRRTALRLSINPIVSVTLLRTAGVENCYRDDPGLAAEGDLSRLESPTLTVIPSRSKYSRRAIVYLRLEPKRSRKPAAVISPFSDKYLYRRVRTLSTESDR